MSENERKWKERSTLLYFRRHLSSILKLNLPILSGKSSDFHEDRGERMRGRCIASTFATKSIIDNTRTHRAMNPDRTTFRPSHLPFNPVHRSQRDIVARVWNFNKISEIPIYCFTFIFEHVIVLGSNRLNARMHSVYGNVAFGAGKLHNSFGTSASQSNSLSWLSMLKMLQ